MLTETPDNPPPQADAPIARRTAGMMSPRHHLGCKRATPGRAVRFFSPLVWSHKFLNITIFLTI